VIIFRTVLFYIVFFPSAIFLATMAIISYVVFRKRAFWVLKIYGKTTHFLLKILGNVSIEIIGNSQLKLEKPVVIIANHVSALDTIALAPVLQFNNFTYVVKSSLMKWKSFPFNLGCISSWCIPVSREANAGDLSMMIDECKIRFENNISVLIFPKGTRESDLVESANTPPTGLLIAKKLKCDVLPVFFDTTNWQNGSIIKDAGYIRAGVAKIHLGQIIPIEKIKSIKETHIEISAFYQNCIILSSNYPQKQNS
jgi:1-acyl-sn-glycerol-3-phosphate acyltransferase